MLLTMPRLLSVLCFMPKLLCAMGALMPTVFEEFVGIGGVHTQHTGPRRMSTLASDDNKCTEKDGVITSSSFVGDTIQH